MKIALIHSHLDGRGGSQRYVLEIARTLLQLGETVHIFCYEYNKELCYPELSGNVDISYVYTKENQEYSTNNDKRTSKSILNKVKQSRIIRSIANTLGLDYIYSSYITNRSANEVVKLIQNKATE